MYGANCVRSDGSELAFFVTPCERWKSQIAEKYCVVCQLAELERGSSACHIAYYLV